MNLGISISKFSVLRLLIFNGSVTLNKCSITFFGDSLHSFYVA